MIWKWMLNFVKKQSLFNNKSILKFFFGYYNIGNHKTFKILIYFVIDNSLTSYKN